MTVKVISFRVMFIVHSSFSNTVFPDFVLHLLLGSFFLYCSLVIAYNSTTYTVRFKVLVKFKLFASIFRKSRY